jgi:hypothetical protein
VPPENSIPADSKRLSPHRGPFGQAPLESSASSLPRGTLSFRSISSGSFFVLFSLHEQRCSRRTRFSASSWPSSAMIGSLRRECVDHLIVLSESHRRRIPVTGQGTAFFPSSCPRGTNGALSSAHRRLRKTDGRFALWQADARGNVGRAPSGSPSSAGSQRATSAKWSFVGARG